jgi:nicotinamide-nucleotide adenylyltransferase
MSRRESESMDEPKSNENLLLGAISGLKARSITPPRFETQIFGLESPRPEGRGIKPSDISSEPKRFGRVGLIGRFKPLHNGNAIMLESVCDQAEHVVIGIGSSNRYNARNPFTAEESRDMVDMYLKPRFSNYEFLLIPDFGHIPNYENGQEWRRYVVESFGSLDCFVSGNAYVDELLKEDYRIIQPYDIEPGSRTAEIKASMVRAEMANGGVWERYVPDAVAEYIGRNRLDERLRKEFGREILAGDGGAWKQENAIEEKQNVRR